MVEEDVYEGKKAYRCEECDFHYKSRKKAEKCEENCLNHNVCKNEITIDSLERSKK